MWDMDSATVQVQAILKTKPWLSDAKAFSTRVNGKFVLFERVNGKWVRKPAREPRRLATDRALFRVLAVPSRSVPLFPEVPGARRRYPGEPEGAYLASYLNRLNRQREGAFLRLLAALWEVEAARKLREEPFTQLELHREILRRISFLQFASNAKLDMVLAFSRLEVTRAYARLKRKIDRGGP